MDPTTLPQGPSGENTQGKPRNRPGVYTHPATNKSLIVMPDAKSTAQQDALVRLGFERTDDAPSRTELAKMQADQGIMDAHNAKKGRPLGNQDAPLEKPINVTASPTWQQEKADKDAALAENATLKAQLAGLQAEQDKKAKTAGKDKK